MSAATLDGLGPVSWALLHPTLFYLGLAVVMLAVAALWWLLPPWVAGARYFGTISKRDAAAESEFRRNLTLFLSGGAVALGIIGAIVQFQANIEKDQRQQRAALAAQNTKRFNEVIKQLAEKSPPVAETLAAVLNLSVLMGQDDFYWPATIQLNAFVRERANTKDRDINRVDVKSAILAISERNWTMQKSEPFPLDFRGTDFSGLTFQNLKFWGLDFQGANFTDSALPGANFSGADLSGANFSGADFFGLLHGKELQPAKMGAKLEKANFQCADLRGVEIEGEADLNVAGACFNGAKMDSKAFGKLLKPLSLTCGESGAGDTCLKVVQHCVIPARQC